MKDLEKRAAQIELEIAAAKALNERRKKRLVIIRSYKGDPTSCLALIKKTKLAIASLEAERKMLIEQMGVRQNAKV